MADETAGTTSSAMPPSETPAGAGAETAGAGGVQNNPPASGGAPAAGTSASAAGTRATVPSTTQGNPTGCEGSTCPECSNDADCAQRGMAGGTCVNKTCFVPVRECSMDKDCETRGKEFIGGRCASTKCRPNPKWRCEPLPMWPSATKSVELIVPVIDALTRNPLRNVKVVACNKLDLTCAAPIQSGMTGTDGKTKLSVPDNFTGYIQVTDLSGYAPSMYFLPVAWPEGGLLPNFPLLPSGPIMEALASALGGPRGMPLNPMRGHMMLVADDCMGTTVANVAFSSPQKDETTIQFYVRDQVPLAEATSTTVEGAAGYLNFPPGTALITTTEMKLGLELGTASVLIRPGFVSVAYIQPQSRAAD